MSKLTNVKGRISYIASHARQENLYAVYETTDRKFWNMLAKCNQEEFVKSGADGKCIEARELIIALPQSITEYPPRQLLELFTEHFKKRYDVECVSALHHNKTKTNYHIHLIFAERRLLDQPIEKVASRNMYYNEQGKHVRTKKEVVDENGKLRTRCKVIHKGEIYERKLFTKKEVGFKSEEFLAEVKCVYTDLINLYVKDQREQLRVFDKNGPYLATKKIGKNNPKAALVEADNEIRQLWNQTVDRALVNRIPEEQIIRIKQSEVTDKMKVSVNRNGNNPTLFRKVIELAVKALELLINKVFDKLYWNELIDSAVEETIIAMKEIPEEPKILAEFRKYERIYGELERQNYKIYSKEKELGGIEEELGQAKGIFKRKERTKLQIQMEELKGEIECLKAELPKIVQKYGYANVKEFMEKMNAAWEERNAYYRAVNEWEAKHEPGEMPWSVRERLRRKQIKRERMPKEKDRKKENSLCL